jgi:hypothetical protein
MLGCLSASGHAASAVVDHGYEQQGWTPYILRLSENRGIKDQSLSIAFDPRRFLISIRFSARLMRTFVRCSIL